MQPSTNAHLVQPIENMNTASMRLITPLRFRILVAACAFHLTAVAGDLTEISQEIERLSHDNTFSVTGLKNTVGHYGHADREVLRERLRRLLEDFDHIIVERPGGGVERVIVLGEKVPYNPQPDWGETTEPSEIEVPVSAGRVEAVLEGYDGKRLERSLLLDTGADFVVLPLSMAGRLQIDQSELETRVMQTGNGEVEAQIGRIRAIWLGAERIADVETAFIADGKLGGAALLGMSLIRRFDWEIRENQLRLQPRADANL